MKLLSLPRQLIIFWYVEGLVVFLRAFKNSLLYLEEDLAVGLMIKLLFIPLFHDSSVMGRMLSFIFRSIRIILGLFAFGLASLFIIALATFWFLTPLLGFILINFPGYFFKLIFFSGIVLFAHHFLSHPAKKIWQIKKLDDLFDASFIKRADLNFDKLSKAYGVKSLVKYLEKNLDDFANLEINKEQSLYFKKAYDLAKVSQSFYLYPEHFFVALAVTSLDFEKLSLKLGIKEADLVDALDYLQRKKDHWRIFGVWDEQFHIKHLKGVNRGWLGVPTPALDTVSEDLTRKALRQNIADFIGRSLVVHQVVEILSIEKGPNVVIVGEAGSGKTQLVEYIAKWIVSGDAPESLASKRLIRINLTKLLSGSLSQGVLAEKIKNIFEEVYYSDNIILFIDEIENLGIGEVGASFNLYSLLLPYLEGSNIQFIATIDPKNYTKVLEKVGAFARLFTKVELPPASHQETVDILKNLAIEIERYKGVKTSLLAIKELVNLSSEYIHDRVLPDSAIQIYNQCLTEAEDGWIKKTTVDKLIQSKVNIPLDIKEYQKEQLLNLETVIHQGLIDQEEAVVAVSDVLRRSAAQLKEKGRPIGSFLFVGPTGTGKTQLAKILADVYFKKSANFIRFDMSEYQTQQSVERLIGASGEEGLLTEAVRFKPYCLILLDEFEKAYPNLLMIFLQILEDGRLTSGSGKVVDFTNAIIIVTSNVASLTIARGLQQGKTLAQLDATVNDELLQIFKPELINRFDDVILFKPLTEENLQGVVKMKLATLQNQLKDQGYLVEFDESLILELAKRGYDPALGARPLRRLIQDTLEAKLSVMILQGKLKKGEKFVVNTAWM